MYTIVGDTLVHCPKRVIERALARKGGIVTNAYFRFRYTSSIPQLARAELAHMARDGIDVSVLRDLRV